MKVKLRLQTGILTGLIDIPEHCLRTDYRLPFYRPMTAKLVGESQDLLSRPPAIQQCLVFKWDGISQWGNGEPILDLVEVT